MKKHITLLSATVLALSFIIAGCAGQPSAPTAASTGGTAARSTPAASPAAPKAAGSSASAKSKIVIYTSMYENVVASLKETLAREFPDCDIQFVSGGTGLLQSRVASEETGGRLGCDMLLVADPSYAIELKEKGMLHAYRANEAGNLAFDYDGEGYWYPVRVSNMVLAFNPERNNKNTVPNSFEAFANDARSRSMVSMNTPHTSGTVLATLSAIYDKYGDGYFTALGRQLIQVNMVSGMALDQLDSGEYRVIMILEESALQRRRANPSRLEIIYPEDGTVMIPSPVMIVADKWSASHNTKTAEKITEWFLGAEGQNAIVDGFMHSVRKDFPRLPEGSIPTSQIRANSMPVNWGKTISERDTLQYKFDEALAMRHQGQ